MPYKDPEAKRRYMARHYEKKIKTGVIPCTAHRKESYGLTRSFANKRFTSLGNGVVMRFLKPGEN